jgi:hypothetical protein
LEERIGDSWHDYTGENPQRNSSFEIGVSQEWDVVDFAGSVKQQKSNIWHGITCIDRTLEEYIEEAKLSISVFPIRIRNVDVANCLDTIFDRWWWSYQVKHSISA